MNNEDQKPNFCEELLEVQLEALDIQDALQRETKLLAEIESLRAENASLQDQLNHCSESYQDLGKIWHIESDKLELEIKTLRAENSELKLELSDQEVIIGAKHINIVTLEKKLTAANAQTDKLVEALEFYGSRKNWKLDSSSDTKDVIAVSDLGCKSLNGENNFADYAIPSGGRRAREILAQHEEFKKDSK